VKKTIMILVYLFFIILDIYMAVTNIWEQDWSMVIFAVMFAGFYVHRFIDVVTEK
jgi:hypothetical protein